MFSRLLGLLAGSLAAVYTAAAVFGATYVALCGLVLVWGTRLYPDRASFGVGASFLMIAVGQAAGAPLVGFIVDHTGYAAAFLSAATAGVLGAAVRPRRSDEPKNHPMPPAQPTTTTRHDHLRPATP